jgi:hypothetical protein
MIYSPAQHPWIDVINTLIAYLFYAGVPGGPERPITFTVILRQPKHAIPSPHRPKKNRPLLAKQPVQSDSPGWTSLELFATRT